MINSFQLFLENAKGKDVEFVHQRILAWLLKSKMIANEILKLDLKHPKTKMEVHGRAGNLFDIQVNDNNEEKALIEIKMWAPLWMDQVERQINHINKKGKKVPLYYFLLGYSNLERTYLKTTKIKSNNYITTIKEMGIPIEIIEPETVADALKHIASKASIIAKSKELSNNVIEEDSLKQFLLTYSENLVNTSKWLKEEAWKESNNMTAKYISFFYHIRNYLYNTRGMENEIDLPIYRLHGRDSCMEIRRKNISDKERYLKFGDMQGDLFLWLKHNELQLNFKKKDNSRKESELLQNQLQEDYHFKKKIFQEWTEETFDSEEPIISKKSPNFLTIFKKKLTIKLENFKNLNELLDSQEFKDLIELLLKSYKEFLKVRKELSKL